MVLETIAMLLASPKSEYTNGHHPACMEDQARQVTTSELLHLGLATLAQCVWAFRRKRAQPRKEGMLPVQYSGP